MGRRFVDRALLIVLMMPFGCAGAARDVNGTSHVIVFVPGVSGDGPWYGGLKRELRRSDPGAFVQVHAWGAPLPLFMLNFSNRAIHYSAERRLARRVHQLRARYPLATIDVVAHSAGCGVALGGLARLEAPQVRTVVLIAPSVSPKYDLSPALARIAGDVHVFHSERDTLLLSWRTRNFGTYDRVKTAAAGHVGFDLSRLAPDLRARVHQHPHQPDWRKLGNDGSHDGPLARAFVARVVVPLLCDDLTAAPPVRSFAESSR
jgi:pimeloyl-ACP methyl ester carboxylesterase